MAFSHLSWEQCKRANEVLDLWQRARANCWDHLLDTRPLTPAQRPAYESSATKPGPCVLEGAVIGGGVHVGCVRHRTNAPTRGYANEKDGTQVPLFVTVPDEGGRLQAIKCIYAVVAGRERTNLGRSGRLRVGGCRRLGRPQKDRTWVTTHIALTM